ncbi:hypothetical protein [Sphingopyxis sp. NJF-3]
MTRPSGYPTSTPIGKFADQMRDPDPANGRAACREIRERSNGELVVFNTKTLPWPQATRVNQLADEIYGPRKAGQ